MTEELTREIERLCHELGTQAVRRTWRAVTAVLAGQVLSVLLFAGIAWHIDRSIIGNSRRIAVLGARQGNLTRSVAGLSLQLDLARQRGELVLARLELLEDRLILRGR